MNFKDLNFNWQEVPPHPNLKNENFSVIFEGLIQFPL